MEGVPLLTWGAYPTSKVKELGNVANDAYVNIIDPLGGFIEVKEGFRFAKLGSGHPFAGMKAIVDGGGVIPVVPLDGWRGRNFAGEYVGVRDAGLLSLGTAKIARAEFIQQLPGWDEQHAAYLQRFTELVAVEIVAINRGYGHYIAIEQIMSERKVRFFPTPQIASYAAFMSRDNEA